MRPVPRLPPLRLLLPAPRRRPDRAPAPDAPAARARAGAPTPTCRRAASGSSRSGSRRRSSSATTSSQNLVVARLRQPRALLVARVRDRRLRLRHPDLLRLLRLHRRRHRQRAPLRLRAPARTSTRRTLARNLQDFWHRWHISLCTWLRDYLYVPLGGSRGGAWKTYRNLMITMLLGGLWHGASWNFVIWGALHGGRARGDAHVAAAAQEPNAGATPHGRDAWAPLKVFLTFQFVCFAWVFFRAPTFGHATLLLGRIARGTLGHVNLSERVVRRARGGPARPLRPEGLVRSGCASGSFGRRRWRRASSSRSRRTRSTASRRAKAEPFVYGQF